MPVQNQKLRTLWIMKILLERTDETTALNATEIAGILVEEYGISSNRRTIYSEIETLQQYGVDIIQKKGKGSGYYVGSRQFELAELKLLVDAVQASKFITEKKSKILIKKLETLCSKYEARALSNQVVISNRPKTENETIYYNVDYIHSAIYQNCQIKFQYAEWTVNKKLRLKKDGADYIVSPWSLTWNDENYYLIAFDENADCLKHYRVDKMQNMEIISKERAGRAYFQDFNLAQYAKKTFGMYGGKDCEVILLCHKGLAGVILDRFGPDTWMVPVDEEHFRAYVTVAISRQFFGWITGIGNHMQIEEPNELRKEYKAYLKEILEDY